MCLVWVLIDGRVIFFSSLIGEREGRGVGLCDIAACNGLDLVWCVLFLLLFCCVVLLFMFVVTPRGACLRVGVKWMKG